MSLSETISILFRYGIDVIHWHYYIIYLFVYTLRYAAAWFDSGLPQNRMRNGCLWESSIRSATTWYEENAQNYDGSSAMNNWWRALCARKTFPAIVMTHHISLAADFYKPSAWNGMNETLSMQPEHTHREKHMNVCIALLEGAARVGIRTIFLPSEVRCLFVCLFESRKSAVTRSFLNERFDVDISQRQQQQQKQRAWSNSTRTA